VRALRKTTTFIGTRRWSLEGSADPSALTKRNQTTQCSRKRPLSVGLRSLLADPLRQPEGRSKSVRWSIGCETRSERLVLPGLTVPWAGGVVLAAASPGSAQSQSRRSTRAPAGEPTREAVILAVYDE
jgi:hypothetical protein